MAYHNEKDLLFELFPATARRLFPGGPAGAPPTLALCPVAGGGLALIDGDRLLELEPLEQAGRGSVMCELCSRTVSRSDALFYRVRVPSAAGRWRYLALCAKRSGCESVAGSARLKRLAQRLQQPV